MQTHQGTFRLRRPTVLGGLRLDRLRLALIFSRVSMPQVDLPLPSPRILPALDLIRIQASRKTEGVFFPLKGRAEDCRSAVHGVVAGGGERLKEPLKVRQNGFDGG